VTEQKSYWTVIPTITGIIGAVVGVAAAIFGAGIYYAQLKTQLDEYVRKIDANEIAIQHTVGKLNALTGRVSDIEHLPLVLDIDLANEINVIGTPETAVSKYIGYEPDYCAVTKVEIGGINALCRVFKAGVWKVSSGRDLTQLACTVTCFRFKRTAKQ
jgi:hypothetical protein